jgi:hypothetical protein
LEIKTNAVPRNAKKNGNTKKTKTIAGQVDEVLEKISHDQLKQFIREKAALNPPFRNLFLSSFAHQHTNESKEVYVKQVKSILRSAAGRQGFIPWNQAASVGRGVHELLVTAKKHVEAKNFKSAIFICCAVMEEMTKALNFSDDSNGDIGGPIDSAFDLLTAITKETISEEIRLRLFDYCLLSFEKQIYAGWEWHLGMLQIASEILIIENEAKKVIACLDKAQRSEYEKEKAQFIKYAILRKVKGEKEAEKYLEKHLSNSTLRREAIQLAIREKAFEKAISISKEGIKRDQENRPGLALEWYDWLLKIAQSQNDKEKIIEYARHLFISNFLEKQDYYKILKKNVPAKNWTLFVEGLVHDLTTKKRWVDTDLIAEIYIKEEWWDRLLKLVAQDPSLQTIEDYEMYLSKNFADELVSLYGDEIVKYMENNTGRNHYQIACKYFRRMKKLGGREIVENIVSDFRKKYPQRKALMEELNRI